MSSLLILLLLLCITSYIKEKNVLNPKFIFNFIWFITLSLYELKISYIQQDLSDRTIFIFWICILCYNITISFLEAIKFPRIKKKNHVRNYKKRRKIAKYIVIIIFLLEILYSKGLPSIWKITGNSKIYFDYGIPSLHGAWCGLVICLGAYSLLRKTKDKWLYLAFSILIVSRQLIMSIIIEGFIYALYIRNVKIKSEWLNRTNKIKTGFIVIALILIVAMFTAIGNFRSGSGVMNRVFRARENIVLSSATQWFYSYMTFSVSNFNNLVSITQGSINHGATMLNDFLPTVLLNIFNIEVKYSPRYIISRNYTVSTYLASIYLDFGITGIGIFNSFIAFLGYSLYKNIKYKKTPRDVLLYSVYAHNIILLFFINFYLYLPVIIQIFYIPFLFGGKRTENVYNR